MYIYIYLITGDGLFGAPAVTSQQAMAFVQPQAMMKMKRKAMPMAMMAMASMAPPPPPAAPSFGARSSRREMNTDDDFATFDEAEQSSGEEAELNDESSMMDTSEDSEPPAESFDEISSRDISHRVSKKLRPLFRPLPPTDEVIFFFFFF